VNIIVIVISTVITSNIITVSIITTIIVQLLLEMSFWTSIMEQVRIIPIGIIPFSLENTIEFSLGNNYFNRNLFPIIP